MQPIAPAVDANALPWAPWLARSTGGRGRYLLALVLLATYYYTIPVLKTPFGYTTYPTLDDFASLLFVGASLAALAARRRSVERKIFRLLWLAALLAVPSAVIGYLANSDARTLQYGIWLSVHYYKMFLVFACATVVAMDEKRFRVTLTLVWLGSLFVSVYAVLQYLGILSFRGWVEEFAESGPWAIMLEQEGTQALGPLSVNHAVIGNYMVVALMITFAIIRTSGPLMKLLGQLSVPFFVLVAILSGSRAGLAGVVAGLVVYMVLSKVRPAALIALICGAAVIYFVLRASPALEERFVLSEAGKSVADYSAGRLEGWAEVLTFIMRKPYVLLTGIGLGGFPYLNQRGEMSLVAAHNNYLHWLTECGVLGLLLPLLVLLRLFKTFHAMLQADRYRREIGVAFCSLIVALLCVAVTQETFTPSPGLGRVGPYMAFLCGAAVALYRTWLLRPSAPRASVTTVPPVGE